MMNIRRVLAVAAAAAVIGSAAPALVAQQNNQQNKKEQEKRSQQEQQDIQALVKLVDAVMMGQQPAPADIPLKWASNHYIKSADTSTYIPFTVEIDKTKVAMPGVAMWVRAVPKGAAAPAPPADSKGGRNNNEQNRVTYPWENIHFFDVPADGKVARAMVLPPGDYDIYIAVKEKTPEKAPRNAPPAKVGVLKQEVSVPDFGKPELSTSSVFVASSIDPVNPPLNAQQQQENPYTIGGALKVVPAEGGKLKKTGELGVLFWTYGTQFDAMNKPDVLIEYAFYQKTTDGEKYFNKTAPQALNATTLPPGFDPKAGYQVMGNLVVPLASFPAGDYRLEIKITDKLSTKTLTQNANFTVES